MIRMFVNGKEVVYSEKDIVVFVFEGDSKKMVQDMAQNATCLAIYDPTEKTQAEVSREIDDVKQSCAISPLSRA